MMLKVLSLTSIGLGLIGLYNSENPQEEEELEGDYAEGFDSPSNQKGFTLRQQGEFVYASLPVGSMLAVTATWCGYCVELKKTIQSLNLKQVYYIDASDPDNQVQKQLDMLKVNSFPTIFTVTNNGVLVRYNGGRDAESLRKRFY